MIGREVPLIQGALRTGDLIDLFTSFGHKPTRKYAAAHAGRASCTFRHLAVLVAQDLAAGNSRDDHHRGLAIEEHFFDDVFEAVSFGIGFELEPHVLNELRVAEAWNRE